MIIISLLPLYHSKDDRGRISRGAGNITGPKGELINEIWDEEGIILSNVYPGKVDQIGKSNLWYQGLHSELYGYK